MTFLLRQVLLVKVVCLWFCYVYFSTFDDKDFIWKPFIIEESSIDFWNFYINLDQIIRKIKLALLRDSSGKNSQGLLLWHYSCDSCSSVMYTSILLHAREPLILPIVFSKCFCLLFINSGTCFPSACSMHLKEALTISEWMTDRGARALVTVSQLSQHLNLLHLSQGMLAG